MSQDNEFGSNSSKVFGPKTEICTKGENDENKELENNPPACNFEGDISESETNIKQENDECKDFFKGLLFSAAKTESFSLEASIQDEPSSLEPSAQAEPSSLETSNLIELSSSETNTQDEPSSVETSESENSAATDNLPTLSEHIRKRHCYICNITFGTLSSYTDHELHSHITNETPIIDVETFCCNICSKIYPTISKYRRHMSNQNNTHVPFSKASYNSTNYFRNLIPEINMLTLYCNACNGRYKTKSAYIQHLILCHEIKLKDIFPGYLSHTNKSLLDPDDPDFYCFVCKKTFSTKTAYVNHLTKYHSSELPELQHGADCTNPPSASDIQSKLYCADCNKLFFSKTLCTLHTTKIHGNRREKQTPTTDKTRNYCMACENQFRSKTLFRLHFSRVHLLGLPIFLPNNLRQPLESQNR